MLTKKIALAAIAGTALFAATGAYAHHDDRWGRGPQAGYAHHDDRWGRGPQAGYGHRYYGQHQHYRHAPRFVVRPAPVYYYAPPQSEHYAPYYPPQPVYYAPPRPVIYGTLPIGDTRIRFGLQF